MISLSKLSKLPFSTSQSFLKTPTKLKMSFLSRPFVSEPSNSLTPLFRLLDDFDNYSRDSHHHHNSLGRSAFFTPKFDIKELPDHFELHGELAGLEQKDVEIEFTDRQTLTIRGHSERSFTSGSPPTGLLSGPKEARGTITEAGESEAGHKDDQPTVEDADLPQSSGKGDVSIQDHPRKEQQNASEEKYWVSERSVGQFARSFSFPGIIDQDAVKASMKNGILSILVPKAKKQAGRKITIS